MKQFKHKTLGRIVKYMEQDGDIVHGRYYLNDDENDTVRRELIENSSDREEIKESIKPEVDINNLMLNISMFDEGGQESYCTIEWCKLRDTLQKHLSPKKEIEIENDIIDQMDSLDQEEDSQEIIKSTIPDLTDEEYKKNYTNPLSK